MAIDGGGVVAARWAHRYDPEAVVTLDETGQETLLPLIGVVAGRLRDMGGLGRAHFGLHLRSDDPVHVYAGGQHAELKPRESTLLWASSDLAIPADEDDLLDLTGRWLRELARAAGLQQWEERGRPPSGV